MLQSLKVGSTSALIFTIITVSSTADKMFKASYRTDSYGKNSINLRAIKNWNKTQHQFSDLSLKTFNPTKIKSLLWKMHWKILMEKLIKGVILIKQTNLF